MRLFLSLLSFLPLLLFAQERRYVPIDSILPMDKEWTNFQHTAMMIDARLKPATITAEPADSLSLVAALDSTANLADSIHAAAKLFLLTGEAHYIDMVERIALNDLPAIADSTRNETELQSAAQLFLDVAQMYYAQSDEGIYVNFYQNTLTRFSHGGVRFRIDQVTQMPRFPRVRLRLDMPRGQYLFTIFLRIPDWAEAPYEVYVNGKDLPARIERGGYLAIRRKWSNKDEIYFDFPNLPATFR